MKRSGNGYRFDENGWFYLHLEGDAYERGYQHGSLLAREISEMLDNVKCLTMLQLGKSWEFFIECARAALLPGIPSEFLREMEGIADGVNEVDPEADLDMMDILLWNGYCELTEYWWPLQQDAKFDKTYRKEKCSGFMAYGPATKDNKIVMAHNSFDNFEIGQYFRVILDIAPRLGNKMFMQSAPGFIMSGTDFFVTSAGLMGTETTIGGFDSFDEKGLPEFIRIRNAMQYANSLDDLVKILNTLNNGGYANTWMFADINRNQIMRFEQGLEFQRVEMNPQSEGVGKGTGFFIGFNAPIDPRIRNLECSNTGFADIRRHQGARQVRLRQLVEENYGQIDVELAKAMISDHQLSGDSTSP